MGCTEYFVEQSVPSSLGCRLMRLGRGIIGLGLITPKLDSPKTKTGVDNNFNA
jgi:hypothetical protein